MNNPIRILFIIDYFKNPYAGTEGQLYKLIDGLDKTKYVPILVVFKSSPYLEDNKFPIPIDILNIKRLSSPLSWLRLFCYFFKKKRESYKLAHIYFNDPSIICPLLLRFMGYKILISRRDMGYWYTRLNLMLLRINSLFVDRVITNSEAVKKITVSEERYKPGSVTVIYNGYQESAIGGPGNVSRVVLGDNEIRIVLVANIRPIKRIADAIHAIKVVHTSVSSVVLYVLGDGDQSQLMNLAEELGVSLLVHFIGPRDDILQLLPQFHIGILCSESEGFSNTLIEYMQSELPVVCSSVGGNPEIVKHGVNGFLYEMGDIRALAKHIVELAMDNRLRDRMGLAGRGKVKANYGLAKYVGYHEQLYEKLLSQ